MTLRDAILDPRVFQALIAGGFVAVGWVVNGMAVRRRDARLRAERVRDVQRALFAEIRAHVAALRRYDLAEYGERIATRIEGEPGYFPTIPTEANDAIFRAILADIHVLPRDTIDPLVLYYSQLNVIGAAIADLRALDVDRVGAARAADMYRNYVTFRLEALEMGQTAMLAIAANMDGTGRAARPAGGGNAGVSDAGERTVGSENAGGVSAAEVKTGTGNAGVSNPAADPSRPESGTRP